MITVSEVKGRNAYAVAGCEGAKRLLGVTLYPAVIRLREKAHECPITSEMVQHCSARIH